jgi:DNA helicase HerA-like ATPase
MFPLIFQIRQLPDLKSQKYVSVYGQNVRQKVLSSQKDFLLLLSDLGRVYNLTFSIRYRYAPGSPKFDERLSIYLVVSQLETNEANDELATNIKNVITKGFLSQFYQKIEFLAQASPIQSLDWVTHIGEAIKYEEIISTSLNYYEEKIESTKSKKFINGYYVPLLWEAEDTNDMLVICQAIASFNSPLILEITLQPDNSSLQQKSTWINALNQYLIQLKNEEALLKSNSLSKNNKNAQLVSRIYERYQASYLTESLYRYTFKVLGKDELPIRSVLGTLLLSGTKKSRYRTIVLNHNHPAFKRSLNDTQKGQISTVAQWEEWEKGLRDSEFGDRELYGSKIGRVLMKDLEPLHRYATQNEISGLFRIVVPGEAPVPGISQENDVTSLDPAKQWIDFGGYETTRPENAIQIELNQLNKHAFICGVPGSGKTTTAFNLLTQLWFHDIPFLVFEPAKTEYRSLLNIAPKVFNLNLEESKIFKQFSDSQKNKLIELTKKLRIYTLGNDQISPFQFNPFEVSDGVPFFEHIANLEASFRGSLPLFGPLPALIAESLEEIYYDKGWTGSEEGTPDHLAIPTMRDLYNKITSLFETKDYVGEVKSNLKAALEVRIGSLLRRGVGAMLNTQRSNPTIAELLKYPTILELDYLNQDQANLITFFLLTKIREYIKRQRTEESGNPEHIILLEEAHNIVGRNLGVSSAEEGNTKQEAANYITRMLAEMRALREGIIIADQLPTAVAAEVVKNTNVKIAHRLVSSDDRKDIGQAMLLDQSQIEEIARLSPGESFLYMEGWYRPRAVKIPEKLNAKVKLGIERSITNSDIIKHIKKQSWYCDGIATVLDTAVTEHKRLCDDYRNNVIDRLRTHVKNLSLSYTELEVLFTDLTREIFDRLVGELHFTFKQSPENVRSALGKIDPRNPRSFRNLQPANHLSLRELLDLRSHLLAHLATFVQQHQEVMTAYSRLIGDRHRQEWQQVTRLSEAIRTRVATLAEFLGKPELATTLQEEFAILQVDWRTLTEREYATLGDRLKNLKESQKDWEAKLKKEVFTLAIEQAKVEQVNQDMKLGGP